METTPRYRDAARQQLRGAVVAAARELTVAHGWAGVRMAEVAQRAGVSRQTVYNEFGSRDGLAAALAQETVDGFLAGVRDALDAHPGEVRAATVAAVGHVLDRAGDDPLIKAILAGDRGGDPLLPYLTTRAELVLAGAAAVIGAWVDASVPGLTAADFAFGAETLARLVVSHIVLPGASTERTAAALGDLAVHLVADARRVTSRGRPAG